MSSSERFLPRRIEANGRVSGTWTAEEDKLLLSLVDQYGVGNWALVGRHITGRAGKQCRERYINHLDPGLKKEPWSAEEDSKMLRLVAEVGESWAEIARHLPGRPEGAVKNRFNRLTGRRKRNFLPTELDLQAAVQALATHDMEVPIASRGQPSVLWSLSASKPADTAPCNTFTPTNAHAYTRVTESGGTGHGKVGSPGGSSEGAGRIISGVKRSRPVSPSNTTTNTHITPHTHTTTQGSDTTAATRARMSSEVRGVHGMDGSPGLYAGMVSPYASWPYTQHYAPHHMNMNMNMSMNTNTSGIPYAATPMVGPGELQGVPSPYWAPLMYGLPQWATVPLGSLGAVLPSKDISAPPDGTASIATASLRSDGGSTAGFPREPSSTAFPVTAQDAMSPMQYTVTSSIYPSDGSSMGKSAMSSAPFMMPAGVDPSTYDAALSLAMYRADPPAGMVRMPMSSPQLALTPMLSPHMAQMGQQYLPGAFAYMHPPTMPPSGGIGSDHPRAKAVASRLLGGDSAKEQ